MSDPLAQEVQRSLGRLESKVDILLERSTSADSRLRSLERKVWGFPALGAFIAFIAAKTGFPTIH